MFCINCGIHLRDESNFCSNCGAPTSSTSNGKAMLAQLEQTNHRPYQASFQTERTLYEFQLGLALLYDGRKNDLGSGHCTITERRIILQTSRGGYQQIFLQDISNLTPKISWLTHSVIISEGGYAHFVLSGKKRNETEEIFFRVKEALMSQNLERVLQ